MAFLAANPTGGDLIEGTGGVRKVRFAAEARVSRAGCGWSTTSCPRTARSTRC